VFDRVVENPTTLVVDDCVAQARADGVDFLVGLGGGSSMDTAKGCNFLLNNGGRMSDYHGYGHAEKPLLPFIAVPTTAGTGSECQSFAVVSRDDSHEKMACGDPKALAKIAILDPELTLSQPQSVATLTALDALSHALESAVCTKRNPISAAYSRESFRLIASSISSILNHSATIEARSRMLLGAAMAGSAIENSMLGAAHATANPLTAIFDVPHGHAVALMLPHVIRFNSQQPEAAAIYEEFSQHLGRPLLHWLESIISSASLPELDINVSRIPELTAAALPQWTAQFNPRPISDADVTSLYLSSLSAP
jgi:alcohol dehydrogenase